ncbi:hypothetical protein EDB81DRAFT_4322 [Dactylonectria macrodidyma]|uniref:Uncharacterized protein n=1 Tax=Dactylonectria macrodidyma TaxID=307937 RepID=A0A9P9FSH8_9HYPO|nr:hypothetical protein EDB81DRAFT_4322 [Dactylonectria macrodidyma]
MNGCGVEVEVESNEVGVWAEPILTYTQPAPCPHVPPVFLFSIQCANASTLIGWPVQGKTHACYSMFARCVVSLRRWRFSFRLALRRMLFCGFFAACFLSSAGPPPQFSSHSQRQPETRRCEISCLFSWANRTGIKYKPALLRVGVTVEWSTGGLKWETREIVAKGRARVVVPKRGRD